MKLKEMYNRPGVKFFINNDLRYFTAETAPRYMVVTMPLGMTEEQDMLIVNLTDGKAYLYDIFGPKHAYPLSMEVTLAV